MKRSLMATVAVAALAAAAPANAQGFDNFDLDFWWDYDSESEYNIDYNNRIETILDTDVYYNKYVGLIGGALVLGIVEVDSSAVAITDAKQELQGVVVSYREENELNGENGYVDPVFGPGWSEAGLDPNDMLADGVKEDQIRAGFFAPIINTVDVVNVDGSGNIGVNAAAGYFNMQMNAASISATNEADPEAAGGWAEATTTSLQKLLGVGQYATPGDVLGEDDPENGGALNNFRDRNTVNGASVTGSGNIGVNSAAGSLNQQANLMTLAVADDSSLAEANSGLIQTATFSGVEQQDSVNYVTGLSVTGASGNVGINAAAGVGNQQLNSLTVAASTAGPRDTTGDGVIDTPNDPS